MGVEEEILIQGLSDGVSTPAQRRLSSPYPLCLTLRSDSREEMSLLPSLSWGQDQAHLPAMSHCDEGADGLEGTSATGQQVGPVVGL